MNGAIIIYVLGHVLKLEGLLMLPSVVVGILYKETQCWAFLATSVICLILGTLMSLKKPRDTVFYLK